MSAQIIWTGVEEWRVALQNLPADLADEAGGIVVNVATLLKTEVEAAYERHHHTGNLASHVRIDRVEAGRYGAAARVRSTARHAFIFEHGTQPRRTSKGASRGISPAGGGKPTGQIFIPAAIRRRREMVNKLKDLLVRHGLIVSNV